MNPKPLGIKSYGHIMHLPDSKLGEGDHKCDQGQADIATKKPRDNKDLIIVQEKLDGSNCAVAKIDGRILALGRAGYLAETSPFEQHKLFAQWVKAHEGRFGALLRENERLCGEWLIQAHGTCYELTHEPFVAFDLMTVSVRATYHDFLLRVLPHGFVVPKLLHMGSSFSVSNAMDAARTSGHGALDPVEGAVWRVEREGRVDFLAKFVRHDKDNGKYLPEINGGEAIWNARIEDWM